MAQRARAGDHITTVDRHHAVLHTVGATRGFLRDTAVDRAC
jgi:hypothetical protein